MKHDAQREISDYQPTRGLAMEFSMEDFPELHAAVKKGQGAVERSFKDMPGFDPEFRAAFRVKKVEFTGGRHSSIVI